MTSGVGLFETMLVVRERAPFVERHARRLRASASALGYPAPDEETFRDAVASAAARVGGDEGAVRVLWAAEERDLERIAAWRLVAQALPIPEGTASRRARGRVVTLDGSIRRSLPMHKTMSYLSTVADLRAERGSESDEGLFVDGDGNVLEGSTTNVFAVHGETLSTPRLGNILPGVTRGWVIENAARAGLRVVDEKIRRDDLLSGSFLTGSLTKLAPIRVLDGEACGELSPAFDRLVAMYEEALRGV